MSKFRTTRRMFSLLSLVCIIFAAVSPSPQALARTAPDDSLIVGALPLYRTSIALRQPSDRARLTKIGVNILQDDDQQVVVLADEDQLETLARRGFPLQSTEELNALVSMHATPSLRSSLQPLLSQAASARGLLATTGISPTEALASLRSVTSALTPAQQSEIAVLPGIDDDGDGLTNTQEQWWCTDPSKPDSDGDNASDATEVQAAQDWLGNRRGGPPDTGKPFAGWPSQIPGCRDDDQDSVPDLAELNELGLNINRESSDRDKFDDGQELFGNTYCPNNGGFCGYGALPRNEDWGIIFAEMPSWVKAPGNHPMVAAFPVPEIDIVESSLVVQTVTVVTTDERHEKSEETSYSTAKTEGTSTSVANTVTWNEWQEVGESLQERISPSLSVAAQIAPQKDLVEDGKRWLRTGFDATVRVVKNDVAELNAFVGCLNGKINGELSLKPVGVGGSVGGELELNEEYTKAKCNSARRWSREFSEDYAKNDPAEENKHQSGGTRLDPEAGNDPTIINNNYIDTDNIVAGLEGIQYAQMQSGQIIGQRLYEIGHILAAPVRTTTATKGQSKGGAQTTTTEQYEEHTVTNGQAIGTTEGWGVATAIDSSHAADLWFSYKVRNVGTEYAREIGNLAFNIYIGDAPNPTFTYFVANDLGGEGKFENFMPGEEHVFSTRTKNNAIPLTLEQLKQIDLGGPIRIVVEDFTYGIDELFYQDAMNAGVLIAIEDGLADGDELIERYLIPTWGDEDSVQDAIARYFPTQEDANGTPIAISTPEYRTDRPSWCNESQQVGTSLWCKHELSTADWWNIYLDNLGDGTRQLQDTPANPNSTAFFRFNQDSDLDGYSDRSELRLLTEPNNPADYPKPELIAGITSTRNASDITATLSLLNTGLYDTYGVEAVMIAPDDSVTITNNTVGGSGRVGAQKQVVVGSRIEAPKYTTATWRGTAKPATGGYYTGNRDRMYTFTVDCDNPAGCDVGSGSWSLNWIDNAGGSGVLDFGAAYKSPQLKEVGNFGLKLSLLSGKVYDGNIFTVDGLTPRDTFQYRINVPQGQPYTEPVVIVSYNDPQGNHRIVTPVRLSLPTDNLAGRGAEMLQDPGVEIATTAVRRAGTNATNLIVNNPTGKRLVNAHLFLEFIDPSGVVVSEVPLTRTLEAGPTVVPVTWNTSSFSPAYNAAQEYIVMAFFTDYQGNILDTAGRPLSSYQIDPKPVLANTPNTVEWSLGSVPQNTVLKRSFIYGNTGSWDILTYAAPVPGVSFSQTGSRRTGPSDVAAYDLTLNTTALPLGPYDQTITVRTSDPAKQAQTIHIAGTITATTPDAGNGTVQRPLDWDAIISGDHTAPKWVEFVHSMGPDPASLHPIKIFSQDYAKLWGVGRYAAPFGDGTASAEMFGDGSDGSFAGGNPNLVRTPLSGTALMDQPTIPVFDSSQFAVGEEILIIQMQGTGAGSYEVGTIASISPGSLTLFQSLTKTYVHDSTSRAQVLWVPHFTIVSGILSTDEWNGSTGGMLAFRAQSLQDATIDVSGKGFKGGYGNGSATNFCGGQQAQQGHSSSGSGGCSRGPNGGGGGGGSEGGGDPHFGAGGGGGYGSPGGGGGGNYAGSGGSSFGPSDLSMMYMGSGGGGGDWGTNPYGGGRNTIQGNDFVGQGAGMILVSARQIANLKAFANGNRGGDSLGSFGGYAGGGGSGGSIKLLGGSVSLDSVTALGGSGGTGSRGNGGNGGDGRIHVSYCDAISGTVNPSTTPVKLECFIAEQVEADPFTTTRLNLPESFTGGRTFKVQYGRRLNYAVAGEQLTMLRAPAGTFTSVTLDSLVSDVGTGALQLKVDVGNDGTWDWEKNSDVQNVATFTSPSLATAFATYWANNGAPTTGTLDVPVKVSLSKPGQVLLTNIQMFSGSKSRNIRLPARSYSNLKLDLTVGETGSEALTVAADVGDDGTIDWTWNGTSNFPARLTTSNVSTAVNTFLTGKTGDIDIPVRFYMSPFLPLTLDSFDATPTNQPDATLQTSDITFSPTSATEGRIVRVSAIFRNPGSLDISAMTAAFLATLPGVGDTYIGSVFVPGIPPGGAITRFINWNTLGFTGSIPIRVVADPFNRVTESNETNNTATKNITLQTRPELRIRSVRLSNEEPGPGVTSTVNVTLQNLGQTTAATQTLALYLGNPNAEGTLLDSSTVNPLAGGSEIVVPFTWIAGAGGPFQIFARADDGETVAESDETNNDARGPVILDSGAAAEPLYSTDRGYGYVDEGLPDQLVPCAGQPDETSRLDPGGRVVYRFDELLPERFYHLDLTLSECGQQVGRQQTLKINGQSVAAPVALGDGKPHQLSILLDPALYASRTISATIEEYAGLGAVVGKIALREVDYRYIDAGGSGDDTYTAARGHGWLDGLPTDAWGTLPEQTARVDSDANVRYRFDRLDPAKRYQVHVSFFQGNGANRALQARIDDQALGSGWMIESGRVYRDSVAVPPGTYTDDGSIIVSIVRLDAASGAMINEITLEDITQASNPPCQVRETPTWNTVYGTVLLNGQAAPVGSVVTAESPRGDVVGCSVVTIAGKYGRMTLFGEDSSANPPVAGLRSGDLVAFRVNGAVATLSREYIWPGNRSQSLIHLETGNTQTQVVQLTPGWNLISFRVDPPVPLIAPMLRSIDGRYCKVLAETTLYDSCPPVPPSASTLQKLQSKAGYYLRLEGDTGTNLLVEGVPTSPTSPIALHTGWNWIGYLPTTPLPVATALQSISTKYRWVIDGNGRVFDHSSSLAPYNTLSRLEPGRGYLLYSTAVVSLTYPLAGLAVAPTDHSDMQADPTAGCPTVAPTPFFTLLYGELTLGGKPAPAGTRVEVRNGAGQTAGCATVTQAGRYGFMAVYGRDYGEPPSPGFAAREPMALFVNGQRVSQAEPPVWHDTKVPQRLDVIADLSTRIYLPTIKH